MKIPGKVCIMPILIMLGNSHTAKNVGIFTKTAKSLLSRSALTRKRIKVTITPPNNIKLADGPSNDLPMVSVTNHKAIPSAPSKKAAINCVPMGTVMMPLEERDTLGVACTGADDCTGDDFCCWIDGATTGAGGGLDRTD